MLSAARPVIAMMARDAEVAQLVRERRCGWNVTSGQELASLLRHLVSNRTELEDRGREARKVYVERFRRDIAIAQYVKVLEGPRFPT